MAKKPAPKFDLDEFKKSLKIPERDEKKPLYLELHPALQACIGLPGLPMGDITEIHGDSDTGKSTLVWHAAAQAQQQKIFPVVIIKERKHRQARTELMGFDPEWSIVNLSCNTLEDIFEFADKIIAAVNKGRLPFNTHIFIDSVGNANCKAALKTNEDGTSTTKNVHQQNAKVMSEWMMVLSDKIGDTRYETCPHYIGMTFTNHVYEKPVKVGGQQFTKHQPRGGKKRKYVSSLEISTKKVQELRAQVKGRFMSFGFISKISVLKNHVNGILNSGEFIITEDEIFPNEAKALKDYKDRHREKWGDAMIIAEDVQGES